MIRIDSENCDLAMEAVMGLRDSVDNLYRAIDAIEDSKDNPFADPKLASAYRKNALLFSHMAESMENRVNKFYATQKEGK